MIPQELITINAGGRKFTTMLSNFTKQNDADSYFVALHSRIIREFRAGERHPDDEVFIDTDGETFEFILDYIRNGHDVVLPAHPLIFLRLARDAKKYRLQGLCKAIENAEHANTGMNGSGPFGEGGGQRYDNQEGWYDYFYSWYDWASGQPGKAYEKARSTWKGMSTTEKAVFIGGVIVVLAAGGYATYYFAYAASGEAAGSAAGAGAGAWWYGMPTR